MCGLNETGKQATYTPCLETIGPSKGAIKNITKKPNPCSKGLYLEHQVTHTLEQ
jgi:hypothetical protein